MNTKDPDATEEGPLPLSAAALSKEWPQWVLFFGLTLAISFLAKGQALDNHWTTAWLLLGGITSLLGLLNCIRIVRPFLWGAGMCILVIQAMRGGHCRWEVLAQLGWIWTWIWTLPNPERLHWFKGAKALPVFALVIGSVMLLHATGSMLRGDWGHGQSYAMTLPWAHRNIAMESLFLMCVLGGHFSKRRWLWWWGFITLLALVYQVRSVLLGSTIWMIYSLWNQGRHAVWIRRVFMGACILFLGAQFAWNAQPSEYRVTQFAQAPDVLKSLDIVYNLKGAESSSIRINLWSWTLDNSNGWGAGLGAWRNDAEGWTNLAVNRCGEALHRAHSELLQWGYEIGWIPLLVLIGLCWPLRKSLGRWALFALPFLAFTFPAERAEILWPLAMLGWWLKQQHPLEDAPSPLGKPLAVSVFGAITLLIGSWVIAQNALGRTLTQPGALTVRWSPMEERCVRLYPQDIALNHADLFRCMSAFNKGRMEEGRALLEGHLEENPRSIPALKIKQKLNGQPNDAATVCSVLQQQLGPAQGSSH